MKEEKKSEVLTNEELTKKQFKDAWAGVAKIKDSNPLVKGIVWALDRVAPTLDVTWEDRAAFAKNALNVVKNMNALWAKVKNPEDERLRYVAGAMDQWGVLESQLVKLNWDPRFISRTYGHLVFASLNREIAKYAIAALIDGGAQLVGYDERGKKLPTLTVTVAKKLLNEVHRLVHEPLGAIDGALARVIDIKKLVVEWKERYNF